MKKEDGMSFGQKIARELKRKGIKGAPITIILDPKIEKDIKDYVMGIEEAHRKAAESKLRFGCPLASDFQPSNS